MNYLELYADFLKNSLNPRRPLRVIFDCSNGATGQVLKKVFLGHALLRVSYLNDKPDGNFPGHGPNPMAPGATKKLQSEVRRLKADVGIIFDADGDRMFMVDGKGESVNSDTTTKLLISYLRPQKIVINTLIGSIVRSIKKEIADTKIFECPVGYSFVTKLMEETEADFAAEHSGHYYFKNFFGRDSGILSAIYAINAISELPYSLAQFSEFLPRYYHIPETNFRVENGGILIKEFRKIYKPKALKISSLDGLTVKFKDYWFNVRPSQNEPLLRLNIEATSQELLNQKFRELSDFISHPKP